MADSIKKRTIRQALADQEAFNKALEKYKKTKNVESLSKIKNKIDKNSTKRG